MKFFGALYRYIFQSPQKWFYPRPIAIKFSPLTAFGLNFKQSRYYYDMDKKETVESNTTQINLKPCHDKWKNKLILNNSNYSKEASQCYFQISMLHVRYFGVFFPLFATLGNWLSSG